ncbi:hypothetical protein C8F01DRAFT_1165857 [Mycena amicta]|nr:hypothetical protein C8F01DRAFT_1165857 [Mycena amicta]
MSPFTQSLLFPGLGGPTPRLLADIGHQGDVRFVGAGAVHRANTWCKRIVDGQEQDALMLPTPADGVVRVTRNDTSSVYPRCRMFLTAPVTSASRSQDGRLSWISSCRFCKPLFPSPSCHSGQANSIQAGSRQHCDVTVAVEEETPLAGWKCAQIGNAAP